MDKKLSEQPRENLDELGSRIRSFMGIVSRALAEHTTELEADDDIIHYFNPNGLGDSKFFILQGISVYPRGQTEKIKAEMNEPLSKKLHGAKEGVLVGV